MKTDRNRFRLYFKPNMDGNVRECYVNADDFGGMSDYFKKIYQDMGCPENGSLLIKEMDVDNFLAFARIITSIAAFLNTSPEFKSNSDLVEASQQMKSLYTVDVETLQNWLPIAHRWSASATSTLLLGLLFLIISPQRSITLPETISLLNMLCKMRNADNGRIRQVLTQDFVGPSNKAVLKHHEAAIRIQLNHRITQLIIYLAGFKTPALKAAGVDNMANLPKKMKKALFHLAAKLDRGEQFERTPDSFLLMLNGDTVHPKMAPDDYTKKMCIDLAKAKALPGVFVQ